MKRFHAYSRTAAMTAVGFAGESPLFLADYLLRFLRVAILLALWRVVLAGRGDAAEMTLAAVLTYTLVAEVFAEPLNPRADLDLSIWEGTLAMRVLRPMGLAGQFAADMAGRWAFGFCFFSLPLLLLAPLMGVDPRPASPAAAGLFLLSLGLGVCVGLALEFLFGALMVALDLNVWLVRYLRSAAGEVLSGRLLPLALLPWGLGAVFAWLPFGSMASAPLRIYTGTGDPLPLLLLQLGWCVLLWPLAGWLWRRQRERLVGYGG